MHSASKYICFFFVFFPTIRIQKKKKKYIYMYIIMFVLGNNTQSLHLLALVIDTSFHIVYDAHTHS